jgi:Fe-S-cluster-containing dehydrogenase component
MPPVSHEKPIDLSEKSRTTIRMFSDEKNKWVYVKRQCMHCLNPACVSACPVSAMMVDQKKGMVYNDPDKCIGCRYCMVACPFDIISFEWSQATPKVVKCTLCKDTYLKRRDITACVDFCSTSALVFGNRKALLAEAKKRIKEDPKRYIPKVYGEKDGGGTNILYLAGKDFNELGFPSNLGDESPAVITETIQSIYSWFIAPVVAFFLLWFPVSKNYSKKSGEKKEG